MGRWGRALLYTAGQCQRGLRASDPRSSLLANRYRPRFPLTYTFLFWHRLANHGAYLSQDDLELVDTCRPGGQHREALYRHFGRPQTYRISAKEGYYHLPLAPVFNALLVRSGLARAIEAPSEYPGPPPILGVDLVFTGGVTVPHDLISRSV